VAWDGTTYAPALDEFELTPPAMPNFGAAPKSTSGLQCRHRVPKESTIGAFFHFKDG